MKIWMIPILLLVSVQASAQLSYRQLYVDYDSAVTYKNLRVIPIRFKGPPTTPAALQKTTITLSQALQSGRVSVQERGTASVENVHWLSLYNLSDSNVYVSSGEVLSGGRQDRMVTKDTIVAARSGRIDLPVMCVEEGRWSEKDRKFTYAQMANMHLRRTLDETRNQVLIWKEINNQLEKDHVKNKTLAYLSRGKDNVFTALQNEYWQYFEKALLRRDSNTVGMVCLSGDHILGSDIFAARPLFSGNCKALLKGYIEEATVFGAAPQVTDAVVRKYLDQFLQDEASQEAFVRKNGKLFKVGGETIHITTYEPH